MRGYVRVEVGWMPEGLVAVRTLVRGGRAVRRLVLLQVGLLTEPLDLISNEAVKNFSFIVEDPDFKGDFKMVDFEIFGNIPNLEYSKYFCFKGSLRNHPKTYFNFNILKIHISMTHPMS